MFSITVIEVNIHYSISKWEYQIFKLTPESKIGPLKLTAIKIWGFICNLKEYYAKSIHVNLRIRPFRAG